MTFLLKNIFAGFLSKWQFYGDFELFFGQNHGIMPLLIYKIILRPRSNVELHMC